MQWWLQALTTFSLVALEMGPGPHDFDDMCQITVAVCINNINITSIIITSNIFITSVIIFIIKIIIAIIIIASITIITSITVITTITITNLWLLSVQLRLQAPWAGNGLEGRPCEESGVQVSKKIFLYVRTDKTICMYTFGFFLGELVYLFDYHNFPGTSGRIHRALSRSHPSLCMISWNFLLF